MNRLMNISFTANINYIKAKDLKGKIPTRYDDIMNDILHEKDCLYFNQKVAPEKVKDGTYTLGEKLSTNVKKLLAVCNIS